TDPQRRARPPFDLPAGQAFKTAFTQDIDTATAAAGDPVELRLTTPVRDSSKKVLVPEGAAVAGRILRIAHEYGRLSAVTLVITLESIHAMQDRKVKPVLRSR